MKRIRNAAEFIAEAAMLVSLVAFVVVGGVVMKIWKLFDR